MSTTISAPLVSIWQLAQRFVSFSKQRALLMIGLMLLNSITSGLSILLIIPLLETLDTTTSGTPEFETPVGQYFAQLCTWLGVESSLFWIFSFYLSLVLIAAIIAYANSVFATSMQQRFAKDLRNTVYEHILHAKWSYLKQQQRTDYARVIINQPQIIASGIQSLISALGTIILALVYIGLALVLSAQLTLLALACAALLAATLLLLNRRVLNTGKTQQQFNKKLFSETIEQLHHLKAIKASLTEPNYRDQMAQNNHILEQQAIKMSHFSALIRLVNTLGAAIVLTVLFYFLVVNLTLPSATFITLLFIFARLTPLISQLQTHYQRLLYAAPQYHDVMQHLNALAAASEPMLTTSTTLPLQQQLQLFAVTYQHDPSQDPQTKPLSLTIPAHTTTVITGPSGVGKSTLLDMIAGLYVPSSGSITVDATRLNESNLREWRSQVAYVTQEVCLINASIRANLMLFNQHKLPDSELWHALTLVGADTFVAALAAGLETNIGDHGTALSGGQRQRLAIARALLMQPQLLILDEATNALDRTSEQDIYDKLQALTQRCTIVIVSHHQAAISKADQVIELVN